MIADSDTGRKDDASKPRWDLLPFLALEQVVHVLGYGAQKYGVDNWRKVENWRPRYFSAAMRHLVAWYSDQYAVDPDTGCSHLSHAICCLLFMLEMEKP